MVVRTAGALPDIDGLTPTLVAAVGVEDQDVVPVGGIGRRDWGAGVAASAGVGASHSEAGKGSGENSVGSHRDNNCLRVMPILFGINARQLAHLTRTQDADLAL